MDERAQTAVEYILLIGAIIFLVVILFIVVKERIINPAGRNIDNTSAGIATVFANVST